jgi:hypothetical protein
MTMMLKKKAELQSLVLQEVQRQLPSENVEISIKTDAHGVWFAAPADSGTRFSLAMQRAVTAAQIKLRPQYDLVAEERKADRTARLQEAAGDGGDAGHHADAVAPALRQDGAEE